MAPAAPACRLFVPKLVLAFVGTILAWAQNGQLLEHLNGAPVRLLVPGWSVKWLTKLEVMEREPNC